jgi:hypothetical protein
MFAISMVRALGDQVAGGRIRDQSDQRFNGYVQHLAVASSQNSVDVFLSAFLRSRLVVPVSSKVEVAPRSDPSGGRFQQRHGGVQLAPSLTRALGDVQGEGH